MHNVEPKFIGKKIRKIRLSRGYKQDYIALKVGLSQTGFSKIETGETRMTLERASDVANALGMTLIELLVWEEKLRM
ncbi:helix-turn-helix domain-containing protein [Dyadobacter psychrotolerans]|nr:helix-turn-helix transcriptional regulator [Dyadobacter psychrotolerans]